MEPYTPEKLPIDLASINWSKITKKVSEASAALAYYNGILEAIVNPSIFLTPLETKEAVLSSRIEGTVTTIDEVLKFEADLKPESISKQNDIIEVLNYRQATRLARDWLKKGMTFNLTLICAIQKELMQGVRGKDKHPGEIRKEQVWVGPQGCTMDEATYVPPEPLGLKAYLNNLVDFMNIKDQEELIQTAIMHAQFEVIHPFYDGNGRTGRILIPLYLWCKDRISSPSFYISEYFDENRDQYIHNLRRISELKDWEEWIFFFLQAVAVQAKRNAEKAKQVLDLYANMRKKIVEITKSPNVMKVVDTLFTTPIVKRSDLINFSGVEANSAHRIIAKLKKEKILSIIQEHSGRSPEILVFDALYRLIR
ncbi:MAG: Fic family protein [Chloroflexi bacterium]|nr:Fic family protein [Chloroflexota bacterium]